MHIFKGTCRISGALQSDLNCETKMWKIWLSSSDIFLFPCWLFSCRMKKDEFKFRLRNPDYLKNIRFVQEKLDWLIDILPVLSFIVVCFGLKHHTPDGVNTSVQHAACCGGVTTELLQKHLRYISSNSSTQCFFFILCFILINKNL